MTMLIIDSFAFMDRAFIDHAFTDEPVHNSEVQR